MSAETCGRCGHEAHTAACRRMLRPLPETGTSGRGSVPCPCGVPTGDNAEPRPRPVMSPRDLLGRPLTGDAPPRTGGMVDEAEPAPAVHPDATACICWETDPDLWTRYGGAVEPGSRWEQNPDCPVHPMLAVHPEGTGDDLREMDATDAPVWYSIEAAAGWASGYNSGAAAERAGREAADLHAEMYRASMEHFQARAEAAEQRLAAQESEFLALAKRASVSAGIDLIGLRAQHRHAAGPTPEATR